MKKTLIIILSYAFIFISCSAFSLTLEPTSFVTINHSSEPLEIAIYESEGTKGPGILLVHGNTASSRYFESILSSGFGHEYRIVAFDLPGYGASDNASNYDISLFTSVIADVAEQTHTDSGIIVGWSLGGDLALQTLGANLLPQTQGLFIFGTAPVGPNPVDVPLPPAFLPNENLLTGFTQNPTNIALVNYVSDFFSDDFAINVNQFNQFLNDGFRTDGLTRLSIGLAATGLDPSFLDEVAVITALNIPVAIVVGEQDSFVNVAFLEELAPLIPSLWRDRIIVPARTGHAIQVERPRLFNRLVRQFVSDLDNN